MRAAGEIREVRDDAVRADRAARKRLHEIAALGERRLAVVDDDHVGAAHRGIVGFAHRCLERADEVEMHAGREPGAFHERRRGQRRAGHDIGVPHGGLEVAYGRYRNPVGGESARGRVGMIRRAAPQAHALDRPHVRMGSDETPRLPSGADHHEMPRVTPREVTGGERRRAGRAPRGDLVAVEERERPAVAGVEERIHRIDRALAALAISRKDGDELHADAAPGAPGRHQEQRRRRRAGNVDRVVGAKRRRHVFAQHRGQRIEHPRPRERGANGRGVEVAHRRREDGYARSSDSERSAALPPAAAVFTVTVRSTTSRAGS